MPNKWLDYANLSGKSGVARYLKESESISVEFKSGKFKYYKYDSAGVGSFHIQEMRSRADEGKGLNSYINLNKDVRDGYADRW